MKFIKHILGILCLTPVLAMQVHAQSFLTNGLVAYYPLDGNANDASGYGDNGTATNAVLTQDRFGRPAGAYYFGTNDCKITSPFQGVLGSSARTVCCWIKQNDYLRTNCVDPIHWEEPECGGQFTCGFNTDATFGAGLFYYGVSIDVGCGRITYEGGPWDGAWHHYAWIVPAVPNPAATEVQIYKDGSLLTTGLWYYIGADYCSTVLLNTLPQDMTIPRGEVPQGFGAIDDLRVYNRALSTSEIQPLYVYEPGQSGVTVNLVRAVKPSFFGLSLGTNYQLQLSSNLSKWTNQGPPFTATNINMIYPQYFDVDNWSRICFRLQVSP